MKTFLSEKYRYIYRIQSNELKSIHPWDVFKEWLGQKSRMFLVGFLVFMAGVVVGAILF